MKRIWRVALNMSKLSVSQKINKARFIADAILSNPATFVSPNPTIAVVQSGTDDLEIAWNEAADGGKLKTAIMHDKEDDLMKLMVVLATYVESVADGDVEIMHLAGMEPKQSPVFHIPDFEVEHTGISGEVKLRVKPNAKTLYHWETCRTSPQESEWRFANETTTASTIITGLDPGVTYYFRVEFKGHLKSSFPYQPISIIVI